MAKLRDTEIIGNLNVSEDIQVGNKSITSFMTETKNDISTLSTGFSNAVNGKVSGMGAVKAGNVSPVKHELNIQLSSDNLEQLEGKKLTVYNTVNILDVTQYTANSYGNTTTLEGNVFTTTFTNGTISHSMNQVIKPGKYTLTVFPENTVSCAFYFYDAQDKATSLVLPVYITNVTSPYSMTFRTTKDFIIAMGGYSGHYGTYSYKLQLEVNANATIPYEPYQEPTTYTANANGKVEKVQSMYPSMTLVTDNDTTITVDYNRDSNKAFQEITDAILSLGGNV